MAALFFGAASAEPFMTLPVDCTLGTDCYIEDYKDAEEGPGQRDYTCGLKSRDDHSGTDFALLDFAALERGYDVIAAAPGEVSAIRDGVEDEMFSDAVRAKLNGALCGNGVRIDHENGYQTLYCHLAKGSVVVREGEPVERGQRLGLIGLSGQTNYPHVHLTVFKDGERIDPFAPKAGQTCGSGEPGLWLEDIAYDPTGMFTAGFSTKIPSFAEVQSGAARVTVSSVNDPIVLYTHVFLAQPGDVIEMWVRGPNGMVIETRDVLEDPQRQLFRANGKRAPQGGWPAGDYRGRATLMRGETVIGTRHADITVN